jgi:hypothetical protein
MFSLQKKDASKPAGSLFANICSLFPSPNFPMMRSCKLGIEVKKSKLTGKVSSGGSCAIEKEVEEGDNSSVPLEN